MHEWSNVIVGGEESGLQAALLENGGRFICLVVDND